MAGLAPYEARIICLRLPRYRQAAGHRQCVGAPIRAATSLIPDALSPELWRDSEMTAAVAERPENSPRTAGARPGRPIISTARWSAADRSAPRIRRCRLPTKRRRG